MKCEFCGKEKFGEEAASSCVGNQFIIFKDGSRMFPMPFKEKGEGDRCEECGVKRSMTCMHHPGCSKEKCPKCLELIMECGCVETAETETIGETIKWKKS